MIDGVGTARVQILIKSTINYGICACHVVAFQSMRHNEQLFRWLPLLAGNMPLRSDISTAAVLLPVPATGSREQGQLFKGRAGSCSILHHQALRVAIYLKQTP